MSYFQAIVPVALDPAVTRLAGPLVLSIVPDGGFCYFQHAARVSSCVVVVFSPVGCLQALIRGCEPVVHGQRIRVGQLGDSARAVLR